MLARFPTREARRTPSPLVGEHLCLRSSIFWRFCQPEAVCSDEGVGEDDELAGDSDKGKLALLSAGGEAPKEGLHIAIAACGTERRKIEDATDRGTTGPDNAGSGVRRRPTSSQNSTR